MLTSGQKAYVKQKTDEFKQKLSSVIFAPKEERKKKINDIVNKAIKSPDPTDEEIQLADELHGWFNFNPTSGEK